MQFYQRPWLPNKQAIPILIALLGGATVVRTATDRGDKASLVNFTTFPEDVGGGGGIQTLFHVDVEHVRTPLTVAVWLLLASVAKILFHVNKKFGDAIPDSALLIVVGLVLGWALKQWKVDEHVFTLDSHTFFIYLLPPIIFDAGYFMPNRKLFENFDSVILFAVVGTIFNSLAIGFTLHWLGAMDLFQSHFSLVEVLLFSALLSAVDPVAVIAVFEEVHVNAFLFVNVFGEALFNDGVAVVLYTMFKNIAEKRDEIQPIEYLNCFLSFFIIAFGGTFIGLFYAVIVSLATRFSSRVKIVAPVFIFVIPYLAYLTAEMFHMSSILAITTCGIVMKQYVKGNITNDASSSVKYFVKTSAQCSETVLFMFLGLSTVSRTHVWDVWFISVTILLCLVYRCIGVVVQCSLLNRFRKKKFSLVDQFVLSYGGLRGAIAFGLAISMPAFPAKSAFITACIAVIFFTVFVQGITIRPLVDWLKVERLEKDRRDQMIEKTYSRYVDFTMSGIEVIAGFKGQNSFRERFERFNARVLKPLLMRHERQKVFDASDILRAYKKIALEEATQIIARLDHTSKPGKWLVEKQQQQIGLLNMEIVARPRLQFADRVPIDDHRGSYLSRQYELYEKQLRERQQGLELQRQDKDLQQQTSEGEQQRPASQQSVSQDLRQRSPGLETDALYHLFSELLDRKIADLRVMLSNGNASGDGISRTANLAPEHDIKDNYMEIMGGDGDDDSLPSTIAKQQPSTPSYVRRHDPRRLRSFAPYNVHVEERPARRGHPTC